MVTSASSADRPQSLATLVVSGLAIDSVSRTLAVENINLAEGGISVSRDADGLSWMGMRFGGGDQLTIWLRGYGVVVGRRIHGMGSARSGKMGKSRSNCRAKLKNWRL